MGNTKSSENHVGPTEAHEPEDYDQLPDWMKQGMHDVEVHDIGNRIEFVPNPGRQTLTIAEELDESDEDYTGIAEAQAPTDELAYSVKRAYAITLKAKNRPKSLTMLKKKIRHMKKAAGGPQA